MYHSDQELAGEYRFLPALFLSIQKSRLRPCDVVRLASYTIIIPSTVLPGNEEQLNLTPHRGRKPLPFWEPATGDRRVENNHRGR